jgi:16S rRNA (cytidine1402-2'-O)-methyltransferase
MAVDRDSPHTLVFYESPFRVEAFLRDALEVYGDRQAALCRELTKLYESVERGPISALLDRVSTTPPRGEFVGVLAGKGGDEVVGGGEEGG